MVAHKSHPNRRADEGQSSIRDSGPAFSGAAPDTAKGPQIGERVAKALARAGVASRREIERLIAEGRVALNGEVLTTPAVKIGAGDILTVNGEVVSDAEPTRLWRYHKPVGLLTSHSDPKGRPTVFQNLPTGMPRVISVGRLDLSSEGLLLLTNDGGLARALELPATGLVRQYRARAYGPADQKKLDRLKDGITVEGVAYGPVEARLDKAQHRAADTGRKGPANLWITVTLTEGKNREVRRVLEAIGLKVNRLIRLAYGPFALGTLAAGAAEEVGPRVIRELLCEHIAPQNLPKGDRAALAPLEPKAGGAGPGRRASNPNRPRPAPRAADVPAEAAKPVYKTGWAKPKKRTGPPRPPAKRDRPVPQAAAGRSALPAKVKAAKINSAKAQPGQTRPAKSKPERRPGAPPPRRPR